MDLVLLKVIAVFRPLASAAPADAVFDIAGVGLFLAAVLAFLSKTAVARAIDISPIDMMIAAFAFWCLAIVLIYPQDASVRHLAKLLIPLLSYTLVKNVIRTGKAFHGFVFWMVAGFAVMAVASAVVILLGGGIYYVSYWTGLPRYRGIYTGAHNLGHSMTLFLMVLTIYYVLRPSGANRPPAVWRERAVYAALAAPALYSLYMSQVRSAILGLMCFATVYLWFTNRKALVSGAAALAFVAAVTAPYWVPALLPGLVVVEQGRAEGDLSQLGSGRLDYWRHNLQLFVELPIDRKIAGVGIGNTAGHMQTNSDDLIDSHNDWLELLVQTGVVGLLIFVALQVLILRAILRLPAEERHVFLALFVAVSVMMFVSNSYVWRIQVGHLYFMLIAFAEVRSAATRGARPAEGAALARARVARFQRTT